jgi:hypothetical protein
VSAEKKIADAKEQMLERAGRWPWLVGVGVGKVDEAVGLIASVKKGSGDTARRTIGRMGLTVPIRVREVGPIRARAQFAGAPRRRMSTGEEATLRAAAADRRRSSE